jgi:hypothetical protein
MTDDTTKELVVRSNGLMGSVDVSATDTLSNVRTLIEEDFDDDTLPSDDWVFWVNGIRKSTKQEARLLAWDAMKKGNIELKDKNKRPSLE